MKKTLKYIGVILLFVVAYFIYTTYPKLDIVTGFSAKSVASHLFISGQSKEQTEKEDNAIPSMELANNQVDITSKSVTSTALGMKSRTAVFKPGLGAILLPPNAAVANLPKQVPLRIKNTESFAYPYGDLPQRDTVFQNIDYEKLQQGVANALKKENKTRSVLVIYKDQIIAEDYADGFNKTSIFLGWSMTKSITSAVLGVMERQGKITLNQKNLFPEWEGDSRKNITLRNLLNMNSGLAWDEDYTEISDVTKMLFLAPNMTEIQKNKPLTETPNNAWNYSSGTTNLLSGFIRNRFKSRQEYLDYWYRELIDKLGMNSMLIETDFSGHFVGSSYGWATARDWGKFGLLYLHNGNWNGEQIINPSWVDFSKTPTNDSNGVYGGHFWLNAGGKFPDVPRDMFSCNGYQGQYVFIIPSKDLVVVRTGLLENPDFNINKFLSEIISSIQ